VGLVGYLEDLMRLALETNEASLFDPARFAQAVRELAYDAHRTLAHAPSPAALRQLSRRIELLGSALADRRGGPLGTWLDNLGREVRSGAVHRAGSYRRMCACA
jgi:hypothetical protein